MENIELNKVFITNIAENPQNGSLLLYLAVINNSDDLKTLMKEPENNRQILKLFLDTETKSLAFSGVELDKIVKVVNIPFKNFKVITNDDANIFVFISDMMTFNFMSPIDDSYQFLLQFLIEHKFEIIFPEFNQGSVQLDKKLAIDNKPIYLN